MTEAAILELRNFATPQPRPLAPFPPFPYHPHMNWSSVIGHDWAVEVLSAALEHGRVGHAYLFTGSAEIGKTTLALTFAQALNCQSEQKPCGQCRSCRLIAAGRHPDLTHIEPEISARGKATIKIETMRQLQRSLQLAAYEGRYKIAIISGFEAANISAANAFLKTLEEPPKNTVLILTATDGDMLLDTIKSRCRVVALRPVATEVIEKHLLKVGDVSAETAHTLAHIANGRIGWAISAASDPAIIAGRNDVLATLDQALVASIVERFKLADTLARKPEALAYLLNIWLTWWRDLFVLARGSDKTHLINIDHHTQFQQFVQQWDQAQLRTALDSTKQTLWQLDRNVNIRLALENLLLAYPHPHNS